MRPVCIIVRDGWGYNEKTEGNAVAAANIPNVKSYKEKYPWTLVDTSGESVGLPDGYQGSSEVGHLTIGAGRVVIQELKRIDDGLSDGSFFQKPKWAALVKDWKEKKSTLHLMGLLQDEGVHAHQEHLFKIIKRAREEFAEGRIVIHPFLDGRDTPPKSTLEYIAKLQKVMEETGNCVIGTMMGRYYAMDRSQDWKLTDKAYHCIVTAEGRKTDDVVAAVKASYEKDKTPDNVPMFDEYIPPHVVGAYDGVKDGDCVVHTNYRQDRAIQISRAFVDPAYPGTLKTRPQVTYLGLTQYYDEFTEYLLEPMTSGGGMENLLGEVISDGGLKQLRISETQKFRHVTSFMNGKSTTPFKGEDQVEIKSKLDPASYASHPAMEAYAVTEKLLEILNGSPEYAFIAINYANGDMVGHTGDFNAAKKALEVVDECLGKVVKRLLELDAHIFITADHGNSEQMIDYETGMPKTSHTILPVECIYVANDAPGKKLVDRGMLSDLAPTALTLLGLEVPKEMTGKNLIVG